SLSPTALSTLSLHDALPIYRPAQLARRAVHPKLRFAGNAVHQRVGGDAALTIGDLESTPELGANLGSEVVETLVRAGEGSVNKRSEEHTSELQSRSDLVCRL